eukprot:1141847-Pelagomonas_calceolata.AAC.1
MLFILDIIISRTEVTVWGRPAMPSCCLVAKGVNTESKSSHAANDIKHLLLRSLACVLEKGAQYCRGREGEGLHSCTCLQQQLIL